MTRPLTTHRLDWRALAVRLVAGVVLVGYGLVLGAAPTGHGFRLAVHVLGEHHESVEALLFGASANGHEAHEGDVHSHHSVVHSHHEAPPPPAIVSVALDKHTLATQHAVPAPAEAPAPVGLVPTEALASRTLDVEVRPPQKTA